MLERVWTVLSLETTTPELRNHHTGTSGTITLEPLEPALNHPRAISEPSQNPHRKLDMNLQPHPKISQNPYRKFLELREPMLELPGTTSRNMAGRVELLLGTDALNLLGTKPTVVAVGFQCVGLAVVHSFLAEPKNRNGTATLELWNPVTCRWVLKQG